jgi:hypothetical protein
MFGKSPEEANETRLACSNGERCTLCGKPAAYKVEEDTFGEHRHPYTAYVCAEDFERIMFPHKHRDAVPSGGPFLTAEKIEELSELERRIPKGPWGSGRGYEQGDPGAYVSDGAGLIVCAADSPPKPETADFITEMRNHAREFIACARICDSFERALDGQETDLTPEHRNDRLLIAAIVGREAMAALARHDPEPEEAKALLADTLPPSAEKTNPLASSAPMALDEDEEDHLG